MYHLVMAFLSLVSFCGAVAQQGTATLSGYVLDSLSGERLPYVELRVRELGVGTVSNEYGFYSLRLPLGTHTLQVSYPGYRNVVVRIQLDSSLTRNFYLAPAIEQLTPTTIEITEVRRTLNEPHMGMYRLPVERLRQIPVVIGEADPLRALQLLPGVQSANEWTTGLYVRGGGPDQVLVLLDEAVVYNTGHMLGMFSVFNPDALQAVTLWKGNMPARFGGRLASVLEVRMKEGHMQKFHVNGGVGMLASRLLVEGPLIRGRASFMAGARLTYIQWLMDLLAKGTSAEGTSYYFYDFNAKANWIATHRHRLYLSGYFGRDVLAFAAPGNEFAFTMPWGNQTLTLRWNHTLSRTLFANHTLLYNAFEFAMKGSTQTGIDFTVKTLVRDFSVKSDWHLYPSVLHYVRFGLQYIWHRFTPLVASARQEEQTLIKETPLTKYAHELAIYAEDDWTLTEKLKANAGVRLSLFSHVGPYTLYTYDERLTAVDSTTYPSLKPIRTYTAAEPRLSLRYALFDNSALKAALTHTTQYIHIVNQTGGSLPFDFWVPSSIHIKPARGWELSAGYQRSILKERFLLSVEAYHRWMNNILEFPDNYTPDINVEVEQLLLAGHGTAYGIELMLSKPEGRLSGWIAYTLSWSWRHFDSLNQGEKFPAKYDRRHDLSITLTYQLSGSLTLSANFVFASGHRQTMPTGFTIIEGLPLPIYTRRNNYKLPDYHRLDLALEWKRKFFKRGQHSLVFSLYNAYNHLNTFFIFVDREGTLGTGITQKPYRVGLFPILPSITWNFKF